MSTGIHLEAFDAKLGSSEKNYRVIAVGRKYFDGNRAIQLLDSSDGALVAVATVNLPEHLPRDGEVFVKNWSENEGMLGAMMDAGFVGEPIENVQTGHVLAQRCELTEKGLALWDD